MTEGKKRAQSFLWDTVVPNRGGRRVRGRGGSRGVTRGACENILSLFFSSSHAIPFHHSRGRRHSSFSIIIIVERRATVSVGQKLDGAGAVATEPVGIAEGNTTAFVSTLLFLPSYLLLSLPTYLRYLCARIFASTVPSHLASQFLYQFLPTLLYLRISSTLASTVPSHLSHPSTSFAYVSVTMPMPDADADIVVRLRSN
mmetsp:Transcript_54643/g.61863  ORF Transcript_54643/g.61863 Transcript_54643/m.61863 type:complete len:200 (+) Transcript_54643:370-969(+)